jgi:predicted transcriptional regulator
MKTLTLRLDDGDFDRLDGIADALGVATPALGRSLLLAVLDDDALAHGEEAPDRGAFAMELRLKFEGRSS